MQKIDNTHLLQQALRVTGLANDLKEKLYRDVDTSSPEKAKTVEVITGILDAQSTAIRRLVEQQMQINDQLNKLIDKYPNL